MFVWTCVLGFIVNFCVLRPSKRRQHTHTWQGVCIYSFIWHYESTSRSPAPHISVHSPGESNIVPPLLRIQKNHPFMLTYKSAWGQASLKFIRVNLSARWWFPSSTLWWVMVWLQGEEGLYIYITTFQMHSYHTMLRNFLVPLFSFQLKKILLF